MRCSLAANKAHTLRTVDQVFGAGETHMLSAEVTTWAFDRALVVFQEAGFLQYTVTPDQVPPSSPVQLTTKAFASFAPGLQKQYPDRPLNILVNVTEPPRTSTVDGVGKHKLNVSAMSSFEFQVITAEAAEGGGLVSAFTLQCPLSVGANFSMVDQTFHLSFIYDGCTLSLQSSNVGAVYPLLLGALVNLVINTQMVPKVNEAFQDGFELPPLGGVTLMNSQVTPAQQAVFIASDMRWGSDCYCSTVMRNNCGAAIAQCVGLCASVPWGASCDSCLAKFPTECCNCVGKAVDNCDSC
jgi:hypothetical protein